MSVRDAREELRIRNATFTASERARIDARAPIFSRHRDGLRGLSEDPGFHRVRRESNSQFLHRRLSEAAAQPSLYRLLDLLLFIQYFEVEFQFPQCPQFCCRPCGLVGIYSCACVSRAHSPAP